MEAKKTKELSALTLAYQVVSQLGYTHAWFVKYNPYYINYNTLRRIKSGKTGKKETDLYYLKLFVGLIRKEYLRLIEEEGGKGAANLLKQLSNILLKSLDLEVL